MIVVDASALVLALADEGERGTAARAELAADGEWVAPEHIVVEVMQSLRGLYLARELDAERVGELTAELPGWRSARSRSSRCSGGSGNSRTTSPRTTPRTWRWRSWSAHRWSRPTCG